MPIKKHPAKFSDNILEHLAIHLPRRGKILDPFAGVGKIKNSVLIEKNLYCNEIELEWAIQCGNNTTKANALQLPYADNTFDVICTSPTYGNRMADHHNAKDNSYRNTYTHVLGKRLHKYNSGDLQWGAAYKDFHEYAWKECKRVLKNKGLLFLNISNHIRRGKEIDVSGWHFQVLLSLGFVLEKYINIVTPRNRFGENRNLRVNGEDLYILALDKK